MIENCSPVLSSFDATFVLPDSEFQFITTFPMYGTISAANQLAADIFILNFFLADHVFFFVDSDQEVGEF